MQLNEIKNDQPKLRDTLFTIFAQSNNSILAFSKEVQIPYTSLRSFMVGNNLGYKNLLKLKKWISSKS